MGPIRDFDQSIGNADMCEECADPTGRYVRDHVWFARMYEDPSFQDLTKKTRDTIKPTIDELVPLSKDLADYLHASQTKNFELWPIDGSAIHRRRGGNNSYQQEVNFLQAFLQQRIQRIDDNL